MQKGFTLFEMLFAIGFFAVVSMATINILIAAKNAQYKAASIQSAIDNVRFALESITKDLRTGKDFQLVFCPPAASTKYQINFTNQKGGAVGYAFYDPSNNGTQGGIYKIPDAASGDDCTDSAQSLPITSGDVNIHLLKIKLTGNESDDGQPRIVLSIKARANDPKIRLFTDMNLETTVTQRLRDPNL